MTIDAKQIVKQVDQQRIDMVAVMRLVGYPERAGRLLLSAWIQADNPSIGDANSLRTRSLYKVTLEFKRPRGFRAMRHFDGFSVDNLSLKFAYNKPPFVP